MAVTKERVSDLEATMQKLTNKMGTIVEDIVLPTIPTIAATCFGQKH